MLELVFHVIHKKRVIILIFQNTHCFVESNPTFPIFFFTKTEELENLTIFTHPCSFQVEACTILSNLIFNKT